VFGYVLRFTYLQDLDPTNEATKSCGAYLTAVEDAVKLSIIKTVIHRGKDRYPLDELKSTRVFDSLQASVRGQIFSGSLSWLRVSSSVM